MNEHSTQQRTPLNLQAFWVRVDAAPRVSGVQAVATVLREAWVQVKRARGASLGILTLGAPLFCLYLVIASVFMHWVAFSNSVELRPELLIFLDSDEQASALAALLYSIPGTEEVKLRSKVESLEDAQSLFGLPQGALDAYRSNSNPLPAVVQYYAADQAALVNAQQVVEQHASDFLELRSNADELSSSREVFLSLAAILISGFVLLGVALTAFLFAGMSLSFLRRSDEILVHELLGMSAVRRKLGAGFEGLCLGVLSVFGGIALFGAVALIIFLLSSQLLEFSIVLPPITAGFVAVLAAGAVVYVMLFFGAATHCVRSLHHEQR